MARDENLTSLKRRRAIIQGSCTRVKTFVDSITAMSLAITAQLEERKFKLERSWSDYDEVQGKLEMHDQNEDNHRVIFEDMFFAISAKIRELLTPAQPMREVLSSFSTTSNASDLPDSLTHVRLPKINLPTFSGSYDEWCPFFDTFHALIHTNTSLSDIQKLQYLKASVTGDASNIISALEISDRNYGVTWNLLRERYDNKRIIVQNHIKTILDLANMSKENVVELRQIADGATRHIHALEALKRPTSSWDDLLVHILSSKLDPLSLREWQTSLSSSELLTMKQFMDFITHRCRILEATIKPILPSTKNVVTRSQSNMKRQAACAATVKSKCIYCHGDHYIYFCQAFQALPVSRRISEIRKRKICFNCLRTTTHAYDKCTSGSCKRCKAKHNTLLHDSSVAEPQSAEATQCDESLPIQSPTALATRGPTPSLPDSVMLSTAIVHVYDSAGSLKLCRVILDSCSQAHFISEKFMSSLGLNTRPANVSVSGVNNTSTQSSQTVKIRIKSRVNSFHTTVDCVVVEHVTHPVLTVSFNRNKFDLPRNITLADPNYYVSSEVDLLIGSDLFWRLLCVGQIKASGKHPTLQKTCFDWVIGGRAPWASN